MSTAQQLQRALEERAKEIEQLQNNLQKAEADRQKWDQQRRVLESKQPQDVQALTRQKRELQAQLQREESEKQELFMQINTLIREVAELQTKAESSDLPETNKRLESQVQQLRTENGQLKSQYESKSQKLQDDLSEQKQEIGRIQKSHEHELNRLNGELRKFQKELEVKDAAFQSLKLAKPSSKEDSLERELDKLKTELTQRLQENSQLSVQKNELEQFKNQLSAELSQVKRQFEEQQEKLQRSDKNQDDILEVFEHAGIPSTSNMGTLKRKIVSMKNDANEEVGRRKKLETELDQLRQTLNSSNSARTELARRLDEFREENERLQEKASIEGELHTLMVSLREAKTEIASKEAESTSWHQKAMQLEEQCDQLHSDLAHKQSALQKAEHELHSLRSTAVDTEILSKLEAELHDSRHETEDQRQKLREAVTGRERSEVELIKTQTELSDLKTQLTAIDTKLEESELKRQQLEQKRVEEQKRLRDEHKKDVYRIQRENLDEKERIEEKVALAEEDTKKAQADAEETRKSVEEAQKRLAHALNCSANFDLILSTVTENEQKLRQLQQQLENGDSMRREQDSQLSEELRRLRDREASLESLLSTARSNEERLEKQIRHLEDKELKSNASTEDRLRLLESDRDELSKMNEELRRNATEEQKQHDMEIKNMRDEMVENIKRLSDLLESETKRLQQANADRDRWLQEAQQRERENSELRKQLDSKPAAPMLSNGTSSETAELKAKVAELEDENAKLAGDLLKMESGGGNSALEDELRHAQRRFNEEQAKWRKERAELEAQINEMKQKQNGQLANGINGFNSNPTPKPRRINGNGLISPPRLSNLSESSSADEFPTTNGKDPTKTNTELEKQKRLITVLRKKLQSQQIERVRQARSFCTS